MMTYIEKTDKWEGSCNQGNISMSYNTLVQLLGRPHAVGQFDKTTTEWAFEWSNDEGDGGVFTVYDYYFSRADDADDKTNWSVGGKKLMDFYAFMDVIENNREDLFIQSQARAIGSV